MDQLQAFSNSPMRASRIISTNVVNLQHESLGDIKDMVIDQATGQVACAVVSFGGFDSGHWPTMTDEKWNLDQHSFYDRTPYWDRAPKAEPRVN